MQNAITEASNSPAVNRKLFYPLGAALLLLLVLPTVAWGVFEHLYPACRAFLADIDLQFFKGQSLAWGQSTKGFMVGWMCIVALFAVALTIGQVGTTVATRTAWAIAGVAFALAIASWAWHPPFSAYTQTVAAGSFQQYQLALILFCNVLCRIAAAIVGVVVLMSLLPSSPSQEEDYGW